MNREAYELANELQTELLKNGDCLMETLDEMEMRRYQQAVLKEIREEKKMRRRTFGRRSAAACAAVVLLTGATVFGGEVHAAIRQISWSLSSALGLSADLEAYRDVVNTSVADHGYVVTLQEAVVSEEKLVVNYTIQQEDGASMEEILVPSGVVYVNGKPVLNGAGGSAGYLDEEQKIVGAEIRYELPGMDLSSVNEYRLVVDSLGHEKDLEGKWEFAFEAEGADLIADTRRIRLQKEFILPDGVSITLEELTLNDLEQRISYRTSERTDYVLQVLTEDSKGHKAEFDTIYYDGKIGSGYMQNQEIIEDGRIDAEAESVDLTFYTVELPKESGRMSDDYVQVGDTFSVTLSF